MAKYHSVETREYRLERMAEWLENLAYDKIPTEPDFDFRVGARRLTKWLNEKPKLNTL